MWCNVRRRWGCPRGARTPFRFQGNTPPSPGEDTDEKHGEQKQKQQRKENKKKTQHWDKSISSVPNSEYLFDLCSQI